MRVGTITVVGAGMGGASTAMRLGERELAERIVLVDVRGGVAQAMALDIAQALPFAGSDTRVEGGDGYEATAGSDLVIITAGLPRKPGQSRADLLEANGRVVAAVSAEVRERSPGAVVVVVTNPLDEMTALAQRVTGFPPARVIGMAGLLDTARLRAFVAARTGTPPSQVEALTLGSHGDTMVPVPRLTTVAGRPVADVLPAEDVNALVERTRDGGAEIVRLLERGSAWWAPSAAVVEMAQAIVRDERRVLPVSAWCDGPFGIAGAYVGVPARLGRAGVVEIVDPGLEPAEVEALRAAADEVRSRAAELDAILGDALPPRPAAPAAPPARAPRANGTPEEQRVERVGDLRVESRIRAAARKRLAQEGRLAMLDDVVDAAMRRLVR